MVPDYPSIKAHARQTLMEWTQRQVPLLGPLLRDISRSRQHEGASARLVRADGSEGRMDYPESSFSFSLERAEMRSFDMARIQSKLLELAKKFADAQEQMMFRHLSEAVDATGNTVDTGGDMQPKHLLEMMRKIRMDFDPVTNEPKGLAFVVHPDALDRLMAKWKSWEQDPAFVQEYESILAQKREEWRARESDRRLVD
jgi:hypothetical protein